MLPRPLLGVRVGEKEGLGFVGKVYSGVYTSGWRSLATAVARGVLAPTLTRIETYKINNITHSRRDVGGGGGRVSGWLSLCVSGGCHFKSGLSKLGIATRGPIMRIIALAEPNWADRR